MPASVYIIEGITGAGKDTICNRLLELLQTVRVGASLCQETLHTTRDHEQINWMLEERRTPPEEIADETHLRLGLVRRLAWLHESTPRI